MSKKELRHRRTARLFKKWLKENVNLDDHRKIEMFNAIADAEYAYSRQHKTSAVVVPVKKART